MKLAAVIGAFTGLQGAVMTFVLSSLAGGVWSLGLLVFGNANRKTAVRFGPFLALSAYFVNLYGSQILQFYLHLL